MFASVLTKLRLGNHLKSLTTQTRTCHSVFGIKELIQPQKLGNFRVSQVSPDEHNKMLDIIKQYYMPNHVLVRDRNLDLSSDCALDEYFLNLFKQGNSLYLTAEDGTVAGLSVNFASSPVDPRNLRNYAFYRQDSNTKDFLYFMAKMQETPNLWDIFKESKIFEIKMIAVLPEFRRQGLATLLAEKSKELAHDQNYNIVRMDCINPHDYKIAERCMMNCVIKFPLHKVRGATAPFIKRSSDLNVLLRVYVAARAQPNVKDDLDHELKRLELLIE
ncbi:unnamed protein product [Arctia plantaginis]|uniref:N-acetyltransferase domain-containing protein n=1 Tax=Arctia plantaginis TaxID=874455 RepID=A0A8S1AEZ8_ARCPL|nr:unnamed protein product [Arctia plantaginis]